MIKIKRIYDPVSKDDGKRILVDRLWPRGLKKEKAVIDEWLKDIAPSDELRKWFSHDPSKWEEFKKRYRKELEDRQETIRDLRTEARRKTVTLLFAGITCPVRVAIGPKARPMLDWTKPTVTSTLSGVESELVSLAAMVVCTPVTTGIGLTLMAVVK